MEGLRFSAVYCVQLREQRYQPAHLRLHKRFLQEVVQKPLLSSTTVGTSLRHCAGRQRHDSYTTTTIGTVSSVSAQDDDVVWSAGPPGTGESCPAHHHHHHQLSRLRCRRVRQGVERNCAAADSQCAGDSEQSRKYTGFVNSRRNCGNGPRQ